MKVAYFDCFSGISGDMVLGAFLDSGLPYELLMAELGKLNLDGYRIELKELKKSGIKGTKVYVTETHKHDHHHDHDHAHEHAHGHHHHHHHGRNLADIVKIISESSIASGAKEKAIAIFERLGKAEAKVHNISLDKVHFHEVGAIDSIVDIVGAAICFDLMDIEEVYASHLHIGQGFVRCEHGVLPVPAPATAELLKGIPVYVKDDVKGELVTPTGAAIVSTLAKGFGPMPGMVIEKIGYGAGEKELAIPNLLRLTIGEVTGSSSEQEDEILVLETNIDDLNPEVYTYVSDKLFSQGALDVFLTPIQMKKGRPATLLTVLTREEIQDKIQEIIFRETTTSGIRIQRVKRRKLRREMEEVQTAFGAVNVKTFYDADGLKLKAKPEHDLCREIAEKYDVPLWKVYRGIEKAIKE